MFKTTWQRLGRLKLEFWLPLPFIGLAFLIGTGWLTDRVLFHAYATTAQLQSNHESQIELSLKVTIVSIEAEINQRQEITEVTVRTADSIVKELELDLPVTEYEQVEAALMQEFGLSQAAVKRLTRYRIDP
jgi:hypothetical protein